MKNIVELKEDLGTSYIVVSKIRELHMSFGELAITYDNGNKLVISVQEPEGVLQAIIAVIEKQQSR